MIRLVFLLAALGVLACAVTFVVTGDARWRQRTVRGLGLFIGMTVIFFGFVIMVRMLGRVL